MLDLRRLKVLREVAQLGSFSATATALTFSPSAVSQQIAQLEREVGARLVERRSNGVVLTPAGEVLLGHANAILARAADAEEDLRQFIDGMSGTLRVAAFASAAAALMPEAVIALRRALPRVAIELAEQETRTSVDAIRRAELDLAVVVQGGIGQPDPALDVIPMLDDHVDVLLPVSHRLAKAPSVSLEELRDDPWAECYGNPVQNHMATLGIEPNIVFHSDHHYVIEGVVAAGVAVAFVPRLVQPVTRRDVVVKPIAPDPPVRRVAIAVRAGDHRSTAVTTLVDVLHNVVASRERAARRAVVELHPVAETPGA